MVFKTKFCVFGQRVHYRRIRRFPIQYRRGFQRFSMQRIFRLLFPQAIQQPQPTRGDFFSNPYNNSRFPRMN